CELAGRRFARVFRFVRPPAVVRGEAGVRASRLVEFALDRELEMILMDATIGGGRQKGRGECRILDLRARQHVPGGKFSKVDVVTQRCRSRQLPAPNASAPRLLGLWTI